MINTLYTKSALVFGVLSLAGSALAQDVTDSEREQALRYLTETRAGVVEAVKGLSEAQLNFKPAADRWSIAEVLEHITVVEDLALNSVRPRLEKAPAPPVDWDAKKVDAKVLAMLPDRSTKYQAPPQIQPTRRWTPAATLDHFLASRAETINWLKSSNDLRAHVVAHPAFGPLDGYEWILAVAGHSERHTKQILEVKADPNFPAKF